MLAGLLRLHSGCCEYLSIASDGKCTKDHAGNTSIIAPNIPLSSRYPSTRPLSFSSVPSSGHPTLLLLIALECARSLALSLWLIVGQRVLVFWNLADGWWPQRHRDRRVLTDFIHTALAAVWFEQFGSLHFDRIPDSRALLFDAPFVLLEIPMLFLSKSSSLWISIGSQAFFRCSNPCCILFCSWTSFRTATSLWPPFFHRFFSLSLCFPSVSTNPGRV